MAAPNLQDLLAPQTADQEKSTLLSRLAGKAFPVTTWQSGGVARTIIELIAQGLADATALIANVAAGGFVGYAAGAWLTLLAKQLYDLDRKLAVVTQGTCVLTAAANSSGFTIAPGQIVAKSSSGLRFSNMNGGSLVAGGTLSLTFQGESAGSAYNVGVGAITVMVTPLPGVAINNPDNGSGTWITSQGTDDENDASLQARCHARWPSLGSAPTQDVFNLWAVTADATVTRTKVLQDATTPGQVDLYLAGSSGGVSGGAVANVQAYVNPRLPVTNTCVASSATNELIDVVATLYVHAGFETSAQDAANSNLVAYMNGVDIDGVVYESDVIEALQSPQGVRNVTLTKLCRDAVGTGVGDIDLSLISGAARVATLSAAITIVTV